MKNLKLKVDNVLPELSLEGVDKVSVDLASFKKDKFSYRSKSYGARFNADLLAKSGKVLDSGFVFVDLKQDLFKSVVVEDQDVDSYTFEVALKGFDDQYAKTESVSLKVSDTQKEVLDMLFKATNKAGEGFDAVKDKISELLGESDEQGKQFIAKINDFLADYSDKACCAVSEGQVKAKDFAARAKKNELTGKEMFIVAGVTSVLATLLLKGRNK